MTQPSNENLHREEQDSPAPEDALPQPVAKVPQGHHDDEYELAVARSEVEMGLRDYVPDDVPDATEPPPDLDDET